MTPTYRRFIAAMGAVFAVLATVSLTVYFFDMNLWGGALGVAAVFCYIIAFALLFLIRLNDRKAEDNDNSFKFIPPENSDGENAENGAETPENETVENGAETPENEATEEPSETVNNSEKAEAAELKEQSIKKNPK